MQCECNRNKKSNKEASNDWGNNDRKGFVNVNSGNLSFIESNCPFNWLIVLKSNTNLPEYSEFPDVFFDIWNVGDPEEEEGKHKSDKWNHNEPLQHE